MVINDEFWRFVERNRDSDPNALRLKYHGRDDMDFDVSLAIVQIECRRRYAAKLADTLEACPRWLFPSVLAGEQSTSDRLARYHASLVDTGASVVDLTAGLGIDVRHIAARASRVVAVELDPVRAECLLYNVREAALGNVQVVCADCNDWLTDCNEGFDTAFIDPARRAGDGSRVYALADCAPDVTSMLGPVGRVVRKLIVKMSPMLDITQVLRELPGTCRMVVLGTPTECKELVAVCHPGAEAADAVIDAVTLAGGGHETSFTFTRDEELSTPSNIVTTQPKAGDYLYEPYPAVMKAAPFNLLQRRYGLMKLHANTNLYVSPAIAPGFPGQAMLIVEVIPYASKHIKRLKKSYPRISVATRNFDLPADKLRTKLGVTDGGDLRLMAVTVAPACRCMLVCRPLA